MLCTSYSNWYLSMDGVIMVNKIIDSVNDKSEKMGIPNIPKPSKKSMDIGSKVNTAVGVSLIVLGALSNKKWIIPLGIVSILSNSLITKNFED